MLTSTRLQRPQKLLSLHRLQDLGLEGYVPRGLITPLAAKVRSPQAIGDVTGTQHAFGIKGFARPQRHASFSRKKDARETLQDNVVVLTARPSLRTTPPALTQGLDPKQKTPKHLQLLQSKPLKPEIVHPRKGSKKTVKKFPPPPSSYEFNHATIYPKIHSSSYSSYGHYYDLVVSLCCFCYFFSFSSSSYSYGLMLYEALADEGLGRTRLVTCSEDQDSFRAGGMGFRV